MLIHRAKNKNLNITTVGDIIKVSKLYELELISTLPVSKELAQVAKDEIELRDSIYSRFMGVPRNIDGFYPNCLIVDELM